MWNAVEENLKTRMQNDDAQYFTDNKSQREERSGERSSQRLQEERVKKIIGADGGGWARSRGEMVFRWMHCALRETVPAARCSRIPTSVSPSPAFFRACSK